MWLISQVWLCSKLSLGIHIGSFLQQQLGDTNVALSNSCDQWMQRGLTMCSGACRQQNLNSSHVTMLGSNVQRCFAICRDDIQIGSSVNQQTDHLAISSGTRIVQHRPVVLINCVDISIRRQELSTVLTSSSQTALCRIVHSSALSRQLTSAPRSNSSSHNCRFPLSYAKCSG